MIHPENSAIAKAVVTGAGGFIGQSLVRYLAQMGTEVIAVDRVAVPLGNCRSMVMDVAIPGALDDLLDEKTTVFHLAARANVPESVRDPRGDFASTLCGLFEALESARKRACRFIFPSTASIFDAGNPLPLGERAYVRPVSPYAAAKVAGEAYCAAYHRSYGLDTRVARMFSVYGIGMNRFAIHDLVRKMQKDSKHLILLGDGNQIRDYLYIDDVVRGLVMIATQGKPGEDYNLASGVPIRLIDLARRLADLMGCPEIQILPTGASFPGDVLRWYADVSKIKKIGFEPGISLEEGLRKTVEWLVMTNETRTVL